MVEFRLGTHDCVLLVHYTFFVNYLEYSRLTHQQHISTVCYLSDVRHLFALVRFFNLCQFIISHCDDVLSG